MQKDTTFVALDDSKRTLVMGILRPGADEPETRSLPNEPRHVRRFFARLTREGPVRVCYEAGPSGYDLYRQLTALGVACQVMAPPAFASCAHSRPVRLSVTVPSLLLINRRSGQTAPA